MQTQREIAELLDAYDLTNQRKAKTIPEQQQIANKINSGLFASTSMFEFVCAKCKSNGNRFIAANQQQSAHLVKLQELSEQVTAAERLYTEANGKCQRETEHANQLAAKVRQLETQIQQLNEANLHGNNEIERLKLLNADLHKQLNEHACNSSGENSAKMEIDQTSLAAYNTDICNSISVKMNEMMAQIGNSFEAQYRGLVDALGEGDNRRRKTPNN